MNRQTLITVSALALAIVVTVLMIGQLSKAKGRLSAAQNVLEEIEKNRDWFLVTSLRVENMERKRGLTKVEGVAQAVEDILDPMALGDKVSSVKPVNSGNPLESSAEVLMEGMDINEVTNVLYALENAPMLIVVRRAHIKSSFLNPGFLDLSMTLSLLRPEQ